MPRALSYSDYYTDRLREADLIADFPGDEILIDGLHAMQIHFMNNNVNIDIPVVRVMNTAHFLAAYMFATTCSGDQTEYDALADMSLGRDRQMFRMTMIVLAAMLARTEGFRANQCRNLILDNRDPDFDEGVTLYDRFLRNAEKRFAEEDFLIDTEQLITRLHKQDQLIAQQASTIQQLQYTITTMNQQFNQYNIGTQNNFTGCTIYFGQSSSTVQAENASATPHGGQNEDVEEQHFSLLTAQCISEGKVHAVEAELRSAASGSAQKLMQCIRTNEALGYIDTKNLSSQALYDALNDYFGLKYKYQNFAKYRRD